MKFIKTSDMNVKKELENSGFILLSFDGKIATFLNTGTLQFDAKGKVAYSDMIEV